MFHRSLLLISASFFIGWPALCNTIDLITVNTSSVLGDAGSLDFQFDPGPLLSEPATLQILSFASNGTLSPPAFPTGDVTGTLPGTLSFDNLTAFNDYFEDFRYGSTLSFEVSISSAAGGTSGSAFGFSMFSDAAGTIPALTTDTTNGFAAIIGVNTDGSTTVTDFSMQTAVTPATGSAPEPGGMALLGTAAALLGTLRLWRKPRVHHFWP
jgi:hypothetical protein